MHCTCPVCRFELPTDDSTYETERKKRMKLRKPRFRSDELLNKKVSELKDLASNLGLNISGFIDKKEIVEYMVKSGKIDITEGVPTMEFSEQEFNNKSVAELRQLFRSFGLSDEGVLEKKELRAILLNSNRVVILNSSDNNSNNNNSAYSNYNTTTYNNNNSNNNHSNNHTNTSSSSSSSYSHSHSDNSSNKDSSSSYSSSSSNYSVEGFQNMSISQLKLIAQASGVSLTDCSEKSDVVDKLTTKLCSTNNR